MPASERRDVCLVDGYNVIHKIAPLARLLNEDKDPEARERLREYCVRFSMRHRTRVLLVFDGSEAVHAPSPRSGGNVDVVYAAGARKADGWILERAETLHGEKQRVLVVTDDRGIKNALPARVRTISPRAFWSMIERNSEGGFTEKPAPRLEDVEAYFLEAERRQKESAGRKESSPKDAKKEGGAG